MARIVLFVGGVAVSGALAESYGLSLWETWCVVVPAAVGTAQVWWDDLWDPR